MRMNKYLIVACTALACMAQLAAARQLFVDQHHPQAADANPGTAAAPYKTIAGAISVVKPGDEIVVKAGVYRETVYPEVDGRKDAPITLRAAVGHQVVVKGSELVTGWEPVNTYIWKRANWTVNSQQLFIEGQPLQQLTVDNPYFTEVAKADCLHSLGSGVADMFPGSFYYDTASKTLYMWPAHWSGHKPEWFRIEASVRPVVFAAGNGKADHKIRWWRIRGITWMHSNNSATDWYPMVFMNGEHNIFEGNTVRYGDFGGVGCLGNDSIVRNNVIEWNGNNGLLTMGERHLIEGNILRYNNYRQFDPEWHAGGMKNTVCTDVVVRNNYVASNWGAGIWFDCDCKDILIEHNIVADHPNFLLGSIMYEISKGAVIRNNLVIDGGRGIWLSASDDCLVEDNLVYRCRQSLIAHGMPRQWGEKKYTLTNNTFRRNTVVDSIEADILIFNGQDSDGTTADHNTYYRHDGQFAASVTWDADVFNFSKWQQSSNQDKHSTYRNPNWDTLYAKYMAQWVKQNGSAMKVLPAVP